MGRINTNVQSLIAQRVLNQNNLTLSGALERLSTGLKINRGKDDPAGLIASENLRSEQRSLNQAIANAERADQVINIAEGGLQEVSSLLTELQSLLTQTASSAGLSPEEKNANQLQIDSILQTIDRIAGATNFQGAKLLNGSLDFKVTGIATGVTDYRVNGAKFEGASLGVDVAVTTSAQQGGLFLSFGAANVDIVTGSSLILEISGALGSRELAFSSGTSLAKMRDAINTFSDVTGVEAVVSGTGIKLRSTEFGSTEFVSLKVVDDGGIATASSGIFNLQTANSNAALTASQVEFNTTTATNGIRDQGQDLGATINGVQATARGRTARINTDFLDVEVTLSIAASQTRGNVGTGGNSAFTIESGGANFQLAPRVDIAGRVSIGVQDIATRKLGSSSTGFLSSLAAGKANNVVTGDIGEGQLILAEAIKQVTGLRGRLGAFQKNVVGATIRGLSISVENVAAAQSIIRDANFAEETASLTRAQILVSSSTQILGLANQQPNAVLQLLG